MVIYNKSTATVKFTILCEALQKCTNTQGAVIPVFLLSNILSGSITNLQKKLLWISQTFLCSTVHCQVKKSIECFIIIRNLPRVRFWESGAQSLSSKWGQKIQVCQLWLWCDALLRSRNCIGLVLHKKWEATIHFLVNFYLNLAVLVLYIHSYSYRTSLNSIFPSFTLVLVYVREMRFQTMHSAPSLHVPYQISLQISSS